MDALSHADEVLASVHRRHPLVAVPGYVGSPMDDRATLVIPQSFIDSCEPGALPSRARSAATTSSAGFLDDRALAELDRARAEELAAIAQSRSEIDTVLPGAADSARRERRRAG